MKKKSRSRRSLKTKSRRLKSRFAELEQGMARHRAIMEQHRQKVLAASPRHYTMPQIEHLVEADKAHAKKGFFGKLFSRRVAISRPKRLKKTKKRSRY
jgi:hypothetical protein